MRKLFLPAFFCILAFTGCNTSHTNPGGHSPEEAEARQREIQQRPQQKPDPNASVPSQSASLNGKELYDQNCGICHQNGANGAPPLMGIMNRRELPSGTPATDGRVKDTIKMGRANMPGFDRVLNDQQIDAIVAYLHTL
ncbi:MAG TPA: cytochrome c [Terriglobales bacterium]|nr:cytochrome c [Terriglobales bacterium]